MRKIIFVVLLLTSMVQYGFSQVFIGGDVSFSYNNIERVDSDFNSLNIGISPMLGVRFGNFDLGILFGYRFVSSTNSTSSWNIETTLSQIDFGVFGDITVFRIDRFSVFGRGSLQYSISNAENNISGLVSTIIPEGTEQFLTISLAPMFEFQIFDNFTIFTGLGGIIYRHYFTDVDITNQFNISILTGLPIGFRFFF